MPLWPLVGIEARRETGGGLKLFQLPPIRIFMDTKKLDLIKARMAQLAMAKAALDNEDSPADTPADPQRQRAADIARRWLLKDDELREEAHLCAVDEIGEEWDAFCHDRGPAADSDAMATWRLLALVEIKMKVPVR